MSFSIDSTAAAATMGITPVAEDQDALLLGKLVPRKLKELNLAHSCEDVTNPYAEKAQQSVMEWIKKYGKLDDVRLEEAQLQKIEECRVGFLLGRAHPESPADLLCTISKFAVWLFVYDDIIEKVSNKEIVQRWHHRTLAIIDGAEATMQEDGLMRGLSEIMSQLKSFCSPAWKARFSKDMRDYTQATLWEIDNRITKCFPGVEEYKEHRRKTSGTEVMFRFIEIVKGLTLTHEVLERQDFQIVFDAGVEIVNFGNDIVSAPKETKDGRHNLLFAYKNEKGLSLEKAFDFASEDLLKSLQTFEEGREKYTGPFREEVKKYFDGIKEWDDANLLWSIKWSENDSERYTRHWAQT